MGYTTEFEGEFTITPPLQDGDHFHLEKVLGGSRKIEGAPEAHWGGGCDWEADEEGKTLSWNEAEKFYDYIPWIKCLAKNFFEPRGYKLNGDVRWSGEDMTDIGVISIKDNVVTVKEGTYK